VKRLLRALLAAALVLALPWPALAQAVREVRLLVTVLDPSNAVVPGAMVTVTGLDEATKKTSPPVATTNADGVSTVPALAAGRYTVRAEFAGFDAGELKDVRLRPGDNRQIIVLPLQKVEQQVDVQQDRQAQAADRQGSAFGTTLTREQMDALSDDPDQMQQQLQDMAGPGAVIRIDSFEGGSLPPKAQIKAIHITRDQFAAENHGSEGTFIDIITQPGVGPVRTFVNYFAHASGMAARNPLAPIKGTDQAQNYGFFTSGGLIKNRASFALGVRGNRAAETPVLDAALPGGISAQTLGVNAPRDNRFINGNFDYAVTRDQTLRLAYNGNDIVNHNAGVGGYNLPDRAFTSENHVHSFRAQEAGPVGRRMFTNTRINFGWTDTAQRSAIEAPTIRVLDAFTSGGAQVAGGRHSKDLNVASDFDYVRGIHSLRAGVLVDANWFHSDDTSNYLGTYTFESLDAYNAGQPASFTRRIGDPRITYDNIQAGIYIQDDIRVRKSLTLTPGVRYEAQTHLHDGGNVGPRLGITWAPFKNGKTTLRASWGEFYDWLPPTTYEQTLRVDGFRQQELNIVDPGYPEVSGTGIVPPVNRYLLDPALRNPRSSRVSGGLDYAFTPRLRASATYRYIRGSDQFRGLNLNQPIDGVRPQPAFGNVVDVVSDAANRQHIVQFFAQTPPPPPFSNSQTPLWDWKRWGFFSGYTFTKNENNSDGPFSTPATGSLAADWGPAGGVNRHRAQAGFTSAALRNFFWQLDGSYMTGAPYTLQTGFDDNGDLIFNDRPAGVGRNTLWMPAQFALNLGAGYSWTFGPKIIIPAGPMIYGTPAGVSVTTIAPPPQGRFRINLNVFITNITNHKNFAGYTGVMTSPLFERPTTAINPRRVNIGLGLNF